MIPVVPTLQQITALPENVDSLLVMAQLMRARRMKTIQNRAYRVHNRRAVDRQQRGRGIGQQGFAVSCANKATRHFEHLAKVAIQRRKAIAAHKSNIPRHFRRWAWREARDGRAWDMQVAA